MKRNKRTDSWEQMNFLDEPSNAEVSEKPSTSISENHVLCRKNVFYCEKVRTKYNSDKYKFDNVCEITGQQWESEAWSPTRDYEKNPTPPSPCESCELVKCEWCVFNKKNKLEYMYGCCRSCAHKETCEESEWLKAKDRGR